MYKYYATLMRIVDADTLDLQLELGFGIKKLDRFRLYGIDTPEIYGKNKCEEGKRASEFVKKELTDIKSLVVKTIKDKQGKYGRYLAEIFYTKDGQEKCLNGELLKAGLAKEYYG